MKSKTIKILNLALLSALVACSQIPGKAYVERGQPESLLEVSNEEITIDLAQRNGIIQLESIAGSKQPTSAELTCSNRLFCAKAVEILTRNNIPYNTTSGIGNRVALSFQNVVARDCESRYITNHNNPYNLNHVTFGCSVAANQVQMVSDKRQFVDPLLLGGYDGQKAAQNYDTYLSRDTISLDTISTSGQ